MSYKEVLEFWYRPDNKSKWFLKDEDFDNELREKFYDIWLKGCEGLLSDWRETLEGRLAEIIVLDQFSRNLCRGKASSFTQDKMALVLAQEAIRKDGFYEMGMEERKFILMPFMHSESKQIHDRSIILFEELGDSGSRDYAYKHKEVIDKFGRYPHRNQVMGRISTKDEIEFLKKPGSSF